MAWFTLFAAVVSVCARSWEAPVIDLSCFGDHPGDKCEDEASKLLGAASESGGGAFVLRGHGVDDDFIDGVLSSARRLFTDVDASEKERLSVSSGGLTRGYVLFGGESGSDLKEMKEGFSYGFEWPKTHRAFANKLQGPNVWPAKIPAEDQHTLVKWFNEATRLGLALCKALAHVSGQEALSKNCGSDGASISLQRIYRYFAEEGDDRSRGKTIGSSPHTDWGFITIVLQQEGVDGLQASDTQRSSRRERLHRLPNDRASRVVVNVGDFASIMSGGKFYSPVHRVMPPKEAPERISLVHFYYPNYNTTLEGLLHSDAAKRTSLVADQKEGGASGWIEDDGHIMAFGDFISAKWSQVHRPVPRPDEEL
ncbi:hypothetical protein FOZ61_001239 [Perkinsus olseni]|uniref:Fe2OG dioxygenase domain-containing protein n=1 Tax=Perkinsus olseni TaxID=32597 RepID=A0A7J6MVJ9_PEROL|nr:hypothetical protein FOZ61_001239 [Perkinsus olseni]KAF4675347.1 hypothetical protein FOL46_001979 [Perkinsus olseni]